MSILRPKSISFSAAQSGVSTSLQEKKPPYRSSKKRALIKIDGEQSLFFFGLVKGVHARESVEAMRRAKRGRQPEKKKAPLPSRVWSFRVSRVSLDRPRKKSDCSQSILE